MTLLNLILRLLFAHVLMDFIFQSSKMVKFKTSGDKNKQLKYNFIHSFSHAAAAYVIVAEWTCWYIPLAIFVSHFVIDFFYKREKDDIFSFVVDQALHILIIIILSICIAGRFNILQEISVHLNNNNIWLIALAYLLITKPASIFIGKFINRWKPQINKNSDKQLIPDEEKNMEKSSEWTGYFKQLPILTFIWKHRAEKKPATNDKAPLLEENGLEKAGEWIGYIERFLVLTFILVNQWAGIGFLLAAKSIFRYGDLKENKDIRMTEYVLIGTLCSFTIAIICGLLAFVLQ